MNRNEFASLRTAVAGHWMEAGLRKRANERTRRVARYRARIDGLRESVIARTDRANTLAWAERYPMQAFALIIRFEEMA